MGKLEFHVSFLFAFASSVECDGRSSEVFAGCRWFVRWLVVACCDGHRLQVVAGCGGRRLQVDSRLLQVDPPSRVYGAPTSVRRLASLTTLVFTNGFSRITRNDNNIFI